MAEVEKNWIDEMIEREATPKTLRKETVEQFCNKWSISDQTYYNHAAKEDNQKEILKIALKSVKKRTPDILEKLGEKAEAGDMKATEMFLNYVVNLSKNIDIKSDGKELKAITGINYILPNGNNDTTNEETARSISGSE